MNFCKFSYTHIIKSKGKCGSVGEKVKPCGNVSHHRGFPFSRESTYTRHGYVKSSSQRCPRSGPYAFQVASSSVSVRKISSNRASSDSTIPFSSSRVPTANNFP